LLLAAASLAIAGVDRIEITHRDDFGSYTRTIGRVYFSADPAIAANQIITDITLAPKNAQGKVEYSGELLYFQPKQNRRGSVFLEVVNRGRDQALALMSEARQRDLRPENWNLGDHFLLEQGFTVAFLGWQFDVTPEQGLTFNAPRVEASGLVRGDFVEDGVGRPIDAFGLNYCATDPEEKAASLTYRTKMDETGVAIARQHWRFINGGCAVQLDEPFHAGLYEAIYHAAQPHVAGLGLAALRDFASYLKHAPQGAELRDESENRVIAFGYSQSGRLLREFVRDGFNADEQGRIAFDGMMIASAGAGGGSFNHRFAIPGQAGNSVLSILRPVDLPPFTDQGLLAKATAAKAAPRIFYTFSSTEYWARAGSLTHTSGDEFMKDVPFAGSSRLYFIAGTPHSSGLFPPVDGKPARWIHHTNFAQQRWVLRALLMDMDAWLKDGATPPASQYPTVAGKTLVPRETVAFPKVDTFPFADYMPKVWRLNYGDDYGKTRVITKEPPDLGAAYTVLVPQVNADGNDRGGIQIPEIAAPLGTHTGWNITNPQLRELNFLAGLIGSFEPFAKTAEARKGKDARRSIAERYKDRDDYLAKVRQAAEALVKQRFMLAGDVEAVVLRAGQTWDAVAQLP
jgi:hypothetical protein